MVKNKKLLKIVTPEVERNPFYFICFLLNVTCLGVENIRKFRLKRLIE